MSKTKVLIKLEMDGVKIELDTDKARELYGILDTMFGSKMSINYPVIIKDNWHDPNPYLPPVWYCDRTTPLPLFNDHVVTNSIVNSGLFISENT